MVVFLFTALPQIESNSELNKVEHHHAHNLLVCKLDINVGWHEAVEENSGRGELGPLLQARAEKSSEVWGSKRQHEAKE